MKTRIVIFCAAGCWLTLSGILQVAMSQNSNEVEIEEFVRQMFVNGVPYEEAVKYNADEANRILDLLNDREEEQYWANVVIVASIAGDERVVEPLIDFIESGQRGRGELNQMHYNAKTSAIMSLGYVVHHTGSREALDYMIESLDPEVWDTRRINWGSAIHDSEDDLYIQLSTMSVLGLGLSGNEEAAEALQTIDERADSRLGQRFVGQLNGTLEEALDANQTISDVGMAEYYRQSEEQWRQR